MARRDGRAIALVVALAMAALLALPAGVTAWGNGDPSSVEFTDFGVHDIANDIALRTATYTSPELLTWITDWYIRNETDHALSYDPGNDGHGPTDTDNFNAYTDDPDSHIKDWENHTYYVHTRPGWTRSEWDAPRRISQLYNVTRDHVYAWLMNGSIRFDHDQHLAAYHAGLMSHYVMDLTQYGHTDYTRLDHAHPADDPQDATYHSYYEARTWTDDALRHLHVDLMWNPLPDFVRVEDPEALMRDMARWVNGRHGPDVLFTDTDDEQVTLGSTYVMMLTNFTAAWEANATHKAARGYDEALWNLTLENLVAGMNNLTRLWTSIYLDARDMFLRDAPDLVIQDCAVDPPVGAFAGSTVSFNCSVSNLGNSSAALTNVTVRLDGEWFWEDLVELPSGAGRSIGVSWLATAGEHTVEILVDPFGFVAESNETNNIWSTTFTVADEHHELAILTDSTTLVLLQDSNGTIELELENRGNRQVFVDLRLSSVGPLNISVTLRTDRIRLEAFETVTFQVDVSTRLEDPVGMRTFTAIAETPTANATIELSVVVEEREVAPYIEVDYPYFTNVSVPVTFDASGTWDHNGDKIGFFWDFGDGTTALGEVVTHAYHEEGIYVIRLTAFDGLLYRNHTLEVSVLDAIPPMPILTLLETDLGVARIAWTPWNSKYFNTYLFYASTDPEGVNSEDNLVNSIGGLRYIDNTTVTLDAEGVNYVVMETENIYGLRIRSSVLTVRSVIRLAEYPADHPLHLGNPTLLGLSKHSIEVEWRRWEPMGIVEGYRASISKTSGAGPFGTAEVFIEDLGDTSHNFTGLDTGCPYIVQVRYEMEGANWTAELRMSTVGNLFPTVTAPDETTAGQGETFTLELVYEDVDGNVTTVQVWWGDGTEPEVRHVLVDPGPIEHVYDEPGEYKVTIMVGDDDGNQTHAWTTVTVVERWGGVDATTAMGLVVVIAVVAVLAYVTYWRRRAPPAGKG